ncbi:hypothetical protein [Henriciella marina]|uniref:Uncharacterized protein n=1 Tax=Henriciella marina TaxID=453851 RepID=A0ABT4LUY6_9PROT|nr:hypothetical protein [Henriciella marina]MCZ4298176.1 hypothetical protein [Henriciella marina]
MNGDRNHVGQFDELNPVVNVPEYVSSRRHDDNRPIANMANDTFAPLGVAATLMMDEKA